ncbi:MAG TPA: glycosyltransferase, partial [Candidatus Bathyarchaeia archaeon]|nr:glycosyltransferase [Candidatus Bathyarchaeia archaeon]
MKGEEKINILFVLPNFDTGGSEKLVFDIIKHIDKSKFAPVLCVFFTGKLEETFLKLGVPFYVIHRDRILSKWQTARFISDIVRRYHIEVVNTHHASPLIQGFVPFRMLNRVRWIHTEHLPLNYDPNTTSVTLFLNKILLKSVDKVVGISQGVCDYFRDELRVPVSKIVKILNGIDVSRFQSLGPDARCQMRDALGIAKDDIVIGMFANFRKQKNHGCLIRAFALLKGRTDNGVRSTEKSVKLLLAGDGPELENSKNLCQELGLNFLDLKTSEPSSVLRSPFSILFTGARHDIPDLMNAIDIYCLPSHFEGLPFSLIEAFAAGKQVVATDVPGNRDVVAEIGQGVLVEPNNPGKLAEALLRSMENGIRSTENSKNPSSVICFPFSFKDML